jgi:glycosyltransferase involved in cell wall biosynthesis
MPVEALIDGELVVTRSGRLASVVRVVKHRFDNHHQPQPTTSQPVHFTPGALGENLPQRDLALSPDQCLDIAGVTVMAGLLVNGATIVRTAAAERLTYFAIELDSPDTLFAEGVAIRCHGGASAGEWPTPPNDELEAVRVRLLTHTERLGFTTTGDPGLQVIAMDQRLPPDQQDGRRYLFRLPGGLSKFSLVCRTFVPNEAQPFVGDNRRLGVPVIRLQLYDGQTLHEIDLDDPSHAGLHLPEELGGLNWRWTDGDARICFPDLRCAATLTVELAPIAGTYWMSTGSSASTTKRNLPQPAPRGSIVYISGEPETPGHVYRVLRYAESARRLGLTSLWLRIEEIVNHLPEIEAAATLVVWRAPYKLEIRAAIEAARRGGAKVLLDIDDLMIEPRLARTDVIDGIRFNRFDVAEVRTLYAEIMETLVQADACTCTTPEIAIHALAQFRPAYVLPNGFDDATIRTSRRAVRHRRQSEPDGLVRIGYAGGTRTHQRDFRPVARALRQLLRERPNCRLVLFRVPNNGLPLIDIGEYQGLAARAEQIEWRDMVDLDRLPEEIARFDINLAPVETGNMFCEAKSELKFFEAALVDVCTVASPTGPFRRIIRDGETGFLANSSHEWLATLRRLVDDGPLRRRVGIAAHHDVLWPFGPERRADLLAAAIAQTRGGLVSAQAFEREQRRSELPRPPLPRVPQHDTILTIDHDMDADVTVIIPLYNYAQYVTEALDSIWHQTLRPIDLVVIDDRSTDSSLTVVMDWVKRNGGRFNRVVVTQNLVNSGLGLTRNVGFATAETPYVFLLDADNRLFPDCLELSLYAIRDSGAAFIYPRIQQFGDGRFLMSDQPFSAMRFAGGNYIDAMALVAKSAWSAVGGFDHVQFGWEDFDFWCRCVERGLWGQGVERVLAEYRVHPGSMLHTTTDRKENKQQLVADLQRRHKWLVVDQVLATAARVQALARVRRRARTPRKRPVSAVPAPVSPDSSAEYPT